MSGSSERLVYMANQIARNLSAQGERAAILATADHIATFWDPEMRSSILAADRGHLHPIAAQAIDQLRSRGAPPHQSLATGADGGSDAG